MRFFPNFLVIYFIKIAEYRFFSAIFCLYSA